MSHSCKACGQPVNRLNEKKPWPEKCPACKKALQREQQRQWRERVQVPMRRAKWLSAKCETCGCSIGIEPRRGPIPKVCSECMKKSKHAHDTIKRAAGKHKIHELKCKQCGSSFCSERKRQRHCSRVCAHIAHRKQTVLQCANLACGKDFIRCAAQARNGRKYCSWECWTAAHAAPTSVCHYCQKEFRAKSYKHEWQGKNKYCCRECYLNDRWGKNRPRQGSSPAVIDRACRTSLKTSLRKRCKHYGVPFDPACTREAVCERDGWICQQCNVKCHKGRHRFNKRTRKMSKRNAEHDHIVPLARRNPMKGNTFDNSQCLCRVCNGRKHARGGGQMRFALVGC
jgi:hypothetical protein